MEKKYVIPRCNKIEVVEQNGLLQASTENNGFVVGDQNNWVNDPQAKRGSNIWDIN